MTALLARLFAVYLTVGPAWAAPWPLITDGDRALREKRLDVALTSYRTALREARQSGDRAAEGVALHGAALVHWYRGRASDAEQLFAGAGDRLAAVGRWREVAECRAGFGLAALALERPREAVVRFKHAIRAARVATAADLESRAFRQLARAYEAAADVPRARAIWTHRARLAATQRDAAGAAHAWVRIGELARAEGQTRPAQVAFHEARGRARLAEDRGAEAAALIGLAALRRDRGEFDKARRLERHAAVLAPRVGGA